MEVDKDKNNYKMKLTNKIQKFEKTIITAANKHIGNKAIGMNGKSWITREIQSEITIRDYM